MASNQKKFTTPSEASARRPESSVMLYGGDDEEEEEDLDADLDLNDPSINECTHLTNPASTTTTTSSSNATRPKSSSPNGAANNQRSPSRNLMLAIGGMLVGSSKQGTVSNKEDSIRSSGSTSTVSGSSPSQCASSDEIQILIDDNPGKSTKSLKSSKLSNKVEGDFPIF